MFIVLFQLYNTVKDNKARKTHFFLHHLGKNRVKSMRRYLQTQKSRSEGYILISAGNLDTNTQIYIIHNYDEK